MTRRVQFTRDGDIKHVLAASRITDQLNILSRFVEYTSSEPLSTYYYDSSAGESEMNIEGDNAPSFK
jgi:hypothetical protein